MTSDHPAPKSVATTILVIDGNRPTRELLTSVLEGAGFGVDTAADTTLGALKLLARKPDLVLLALKIPGVSGFTFLEYVQEVVDDRPPVVILSEAPSLEGVLRGVKLGAFAFLPKPVHFGKLLETCRSALGRADSTARGDGAERRRETRRPVLVHVGLEPDPERNVLEGLVGSGRIVGEMIDVSAGGAQIIAVAEFPVGSRLQVVPSPEFVGSSVTLTAEIRWGKAVETGHMYGLEFVDLDPEVQRLLRSNLGGSGG